MLVSGTTWHLWVAALLLAHAGALSPIAAAPVGRNEAGGRVLLSEAFASSAGPLLFDQAGMPKQQKTCAHCPGDPNTEEYYYFCCGVCVFERRFCSTEWPRQGVSQRVERVAEQMGLNVSSLTPAQLFSRIEGRTLWFVGDSNTWALYLAVECFLSPFAPSYQRRPLTSNKQALQALSVDRRREPMCLFLANDTRLCVVRINGFRALRTTLTTLRGLNQRRTLRSLRPDLLVWNVGLHVSPTRNYWKELRNTGRFFRNNQRWLPTLIWADTAPTHYAPVGLREGGSTACTPLRNDSVSLRQSGELHNTYAGKVVGQLGRAHLGTWNVTSQLYFAHLAGGDCIHYCHPGAYQVWTYQLYQVLVEKGLGNVPA